MPLRLLSRGRRKIRRWRARVRERAAGPTRLPRIPRRGARQVLRANARASRPAFALIERGQADPKSIGLLWLRSMSTCWVVLALPSGVSQVSVHLS